MQKIKKLQKIDGSKVTSWPVWKHAIALLLVATPLVLLITALSRYSINVPFWDQWELPPLFEKVLTGTVTFSDFFAQHNEHRLLFPRLIMVGLALLTSWNVLYEIGLSVLLAIGIFVAFWQIIRVTFTDTLLRYAALFAVSLILFSPIQFENWMWGWQIQWYLNVFGLVVALWSFCAWKTKSVAVRLLVAGVGATIATYSLASGFFVWLVCVPILWLQPSLRKFMSHWIVVAALVIGSHYIGYVDPQYHPSKLIFLSEPIQFVVYFLTYVSRPITLDFLTSVQVAIVYLSVIVLAVWYVVQKNVKQFLGGSLLPWACLGLYGLLAAASTSLSRLGLGVEQAYSNRYITLSMLLLIAVVIVLIKIYELTPTMTRSSVRRIILSILAVIIILVGMNVGKGVAQMRERKVHLLKVQHCALTATSANDDCLLLLYPDKEIVWPRLEYLRKIHWGGL